MLRVEKPDLVGIGPRWLDQREEMVTASAEAGAHIYTEKPFARTPAEADRMVEAVRKNKVKLQIAHQMRTSPYTLRAKAMIDAGEIGAIQEVRVRGKEDKRAGGEDMMVLGSHLFDMLRYFLGNPKWVVSHVTSNGEEMRAKHVTKPTEPLGPIAGNQIAAMFAFANGSTDILRPDPPIRPTHFVSARGCMAARASYSFRMRSIRAADYTCLDHQRGCRTNEIDGSGSTRNPTSPACEATAVTRLQMR